MNWQTQIEQELAKASAGLKNGNQGLARVCARRAVALGLEGWIEQRNEEQWPIDAMNRLKKVQREQHFPISVRKAAQRLLTTVTQQVHTPMTIDPIGDARLILTYLSNEPKSAIVEGNGGVDL